MTIYKYTALDQLGNKLESTLEAKDRNELIEKLILQKLTIISVDENFSQSFKNIASFEIGGFATEEKVIIAKQLSTMIGAGIPIIQAIDILRQQSKKKSIQDLMNDVYRKIESGSTLSKAFNIKKTIFNEVQLNLIAAGEKSGNLNIMLIKVAEDMEKSKQLRGKILGAMIYPAIVMVVLVIVIFAMLYFMIPQVEELYQSLGKSDLPAVTNILISFSKALSQPLFLVLFLFFIFGIVFSYNGYNATLEGKFVIDKFKLKIPVFGNLIVKIQISEFCRLTSMLLSSGIPIIQAIEIVSKALSNSVFSRTIIDSVNDITKGTSLSASIIKNNYAKAYPVILTKMIMIGEESGNLDKVLQDMYKFYNDEVEQITGNLTKLLEPIILVIVGGFVAFLAVAIYLPIYGIGDF